MLVDTDGVVDQFAAGGVEQAGQLTVDQRDGQDGDGHQAEGQEGAAAAVAVEDRIPVVHEGEDGTGGDGVNKNQFQTFVQAAFRLGVFHDNDSFSQVWLPAKTACPQKKHRIPGAFPHAVFRCCHTSRDRLRRSGCMAASIQFPGPEGPPPFSRYKNNTLPPGMSREYPIFCIQFHDSAPKRDVFIHIVRWAGARQAPRLYSLFSPVGRRASRQAKPAAAATAASQWRPVPRPSARAARGNPMLPALMPRATKP